MRSTHHRFGWELHHSRQVEHMAEENNMDVVWMDGWWPLQCLPVSTQFPAPTLIPLLCELFSPSFKSEPRCWSRGSACGWREKACGSVWPGNINLRGLCGKPLLVPESFIVSGLHMETSMFRIQWSLKQWKQKHWKSMATLTALLDCNAHYTHSAMMDETWRDQFAIHRYLTLLQDKHEIVWSLAICYKGGVRGKVMLLAGLPCAVRLCSPSLI